MSRSTLFVREVKQMLFGFFFPGALISLVDNTKQQLVLLSVFHSIWVAVKKACF